ncbi:MAG TPA: hypothetical protein VGE72_12450, partial [Azospirillum sp.]
MLSLIIAAPDFGRQGPTGNSRLVVASAVGLGIRTIILAGYGDAADPDVPAPVVPAFGPPPDRRAGLPAAAGVFA